MLIVGSVPGQVTRTSEVIYTSARMTRSRQKSGMSSTTRPQTGCAVLYRCPAGAGVATSPYRPTPTAKTAGGDSRLVLDPGGGTEVAWMM